MTQMGNYGIAELLVKIQDQGKRINLFVLSGTELVEDDLVSIVNSKQVLTHKDTHDETMGNIMREAG